MDDEKVYTIPEIAKILRVKDYTIREWLREGKLKGFKAAGSRWRVKKTDLDAFMRTNGIK